jgi:hypothetical protein
MLRPQVSDQCLSDSVASPTDVNYSFPTIDMFTIHLRPLTLLLHLLILIFTISTTFSVLSVDYVVDLIMNTSMIDGLTDRFLKYWLFNYRNAT